MAEKRLVDPLLGDNKCNKKRNRQLNLLPQYPGLPLPDSDEITEALLDEYPSELRLLIAQNYEFLRTKYRVAGAKVAKFNFRLQNMAVDEEELKDYIRAIYRQQKFAFKLQLSFSTVLVHRTTSEYRLFMGSDNFLALFNKPLLIANGADLQQVLTHVNSSDWSDVIANERSSSEWSAFGIITMHASLYRLPKPVPMLGYCYNPKLPTYLLRNKNVLTLIGSRREAYQDDGCFFRILASKLNNNKKFRLVRAYKRLMKQYCDFRKIDFKGYDGRTSLSEFDCLEKCFNINVNVFSLVPKTLNKGKVVSTVCKTIRLGNNFEKTATVLNADITNNHLSLITDINNYAKSYRCGNCDSVFRKSRILRAHKKNAWCWDGPKAIMRHGGYGSQLLNVFDLLSRQGIKLKDENDRFQTLFSVIDVETTNTKEEVIASEKLQFNTKLIMISAAVSSNLEGHRNGRFFRLLTSEEDLMSNIIDYLLELAALKYKARRKELQYLFHEIYIRRDNLQNYYDGEVGDDEIKDYLKNEINKLNLLESKLNQHCADFVSFGFNSTKFDYKVMRNSLAKVAHEKEVPISYIIKTKSGYSLLKMGPISFRDCRQLLHPNLSLRAYLKSQQVFFCNEKLQQKLYFPYSYITDVRVLEQTSFPDAKHFRNDLSGKEIKPENYTMCKNIFNSHCTNLWSYLEIYNLLDCKPLCQALEKTRSFWVQWMKVDILSDGLSVAGLSQKVLFKSVKEPLIWWLGGQKEKELTEAVSKGIIGGISLAFTRYHQVNVTSIRHSEGHKCAKIIGFDCNGMYLRCLGGDLPVGIPAWYKKQENGLFIRKYAVAPGSSKTEVEFCLYLERRYSNYNVRHMYREGQVRLGNKRQFKMDACIEELKLGWNFYGCFHHRHGCNCLDVDPNKFTQAEIDEKSVKDQEALDFFAKCGWKVKVVWACHFRHWIKKKDFEFQQFLKETFDLPHACHSPYTQAKLLKYIRAGDIFGYVAGCDLHFPPEVHHRFVDQAPLFQHMIINEDTICKYMKDLLKKRGRKLAPRRSLVGGFKAVGQTISTPLLSYYMHLGAVVTNIDLVVQYARYRPFRAVEKFITLKRIECASDPNISALEHNFKLAGNSMFGKLLLRKQDFSIVKFLPERKCHNWISSARFRWFDEFDGNGFGEVGLYQKSYKDDTLRVLGFFILQESKILLLSFLYEFWDKYIAKEFYDVLSCDTDCYYFAIAKEKLEDMVDPAKLDDFKKAKNSFLCNNDDICDLKTAGKWKIEWTGDGYIALNSKCCYGFKISDEELSQTLNKIFENDHLSWEEKEKELEKLEKLKGSDRFVAKGVRKDQNELNYTDYLEVLKDQGTVTIENRGLQWYCGNFRKFKLVKTGLTFDYFKRKLLPCGIRTSCLDALK